MKRILSISCRLLAFWSAFTSGWFFANYLGDKGPLSASLPFLAFAVFIGLVACYLDES